MGSAPVSDPAVPADGKRRRGLPRRVPPPLPWARPRFELALLVLVALATVTPVYAINAQDVSRLCLTLGLLDGQLHNDACLGTTFAVDRAGYGGHFYSDKAPGMSVLELPAAVLTQLPNVDLWLLEDHRLWVARALSSGIAFVVCLFLVGRVSEGIAPGFGGLSIVAFGLGTLVAPFAGANFAHGTAGTLGLAAFLLTWRRRPLLAGLAAGAAVLMTYEAVFVLAAVAAYAALQGGRAAARYAVGMVPGAALLAAYNWSAFGAPWHMSYRYKADENTEAQAAGFFGIHPPTWHGIEEVVVGRGGLLVLSPVLAAAALGLVVLRRRYPAEALVCAAVTVAFVVMNVGYFDPYGGLSPGPRFLIPALPFLALGLAPAFALRFRLTVVLAAVSVVSTTVVTLTWASDMQARGGVWGELARLGAGTSRIPESLVANVLSRFGPGRQAAAVLVGVLAATAFALALAGARAATRPGSPGGLRRRVARPEEPRPGRTRGPVPEPRS